MNGRFPGTYEGLKQLKGIGYYTASAVASICFNAAHPVVDGNVYRVLARYFGVDMPINGPKGPTFFRQLAKEVMAPENIRDYNQGIMEFGAIQCTPQSPDCGICPLNSDCMALAAGKVGELPVKLKKTKIRKRYFNYLVFVDPNDGTLLQKRIGNDIWQNLWEFPLVESDKPLNLSEVQEMANKIPELTGEAVFHGYNVEPIVHKLSHQHLITKFWIVEVQYPLPHAVPIGKLVDYPVPVLVANFIKTFKKSYF
ncbi:MAG: A/G-specific adenine glycosylase [Flavobacteriaceae bacterium]